MQLVPHTGADISAIAIAPASVAYKRKPEQEQELRPKQHRRMFDGHCNMYNDNNYNYNNNYNNRQQPKMYYNSNARPFWANNNRAPIYATITTTTKIIPFTPSTIDNNNNNNNIINNEQTSLTAGAVATTTSNGNMQRFNNNNNNMNNGGSNNKRCTQKYINGIVAAAAGNATAATIANSYQQQQQQQPHNNNNNNKSNGARKARYNNNKRHDANAAAAAAAAYNMRKRANVTGSDSSWHHFVSSSCIEEKFLGQHNPGYRNSTSSEATSEDINSSDEHTNKAKVRPGNNNHSNNNGGSHGNGNGNKARSKRPQKPQPVKQPLAPATVSPQAPMPLEQPSKPNGNGSVNSNGNGNVNSNGSKCKQGKWRNNSNSNSNNSNCNQKRPNSSNNSKAKQIKCSSNSSSSSSNMRNSNKSSSKNSGNNNNNCAKTNGSFCDIGGRSSSSFSSSSAHSSPAGSPISSSSSCSSVKSHSSSGISSSSPATSTFKWQREERQMHKSQRQNVNFMVPPLRQYECLDMDDVALQQHLRRHLIDPHLLRVYGFPVESVVHDGAIEIFKCLPHMNFAAAHVMAITETPLTVINCHDGLNTSNQASEINEISPANTSTDSGNISPRSMDSESGGEWSGSECDTAPSAESGYGLELYCNYAMMERSLAKQCVRCKRDFLVDELSGQYLTREECSYHWGKYHRCFDGSAWLSRWTCCSASEEDATGCTRHELHVWTGSVVGVNGPYHNFVRTRPRGRGPTAAYALDCEMSYTGRGLDVTKVSLVALNGQLVYEHYVRPDADIVDYNTRYSGVTAKDLKSSGVKTLAEVQRDLLELIDAETILIGHGLDNDLRALRLVHNTLIDTSIAFPHSSGFPYRRALRHLTKMHLNREIQSGDGATGHSSFEDSRACMELMLWRVRRELKTNCSWEEYED